MAGDVDDVVDAAQDPVETVRGEDGAVGGVIRPVPPILALRIFVVLLVVLSDETLRAAPDGLHNSWPRIAYTNISSRSRACTHFLSFFIPNNRIDAESGRASAAGLHGIEGGFGGAEKAAGFRLPPGVDDRRFLLADDFVIPPPDFRFDGLADGGHVLEMVVVLFRLVAAGLAQHTNRRRRGVEDIHVQALG